MTRQYKKRETFIVKCGDCGCDVETSCKQKKLCDNCRKVQLKEVAKESYERRERAKRLRNSDYISSDWLYC